MTEGDHGSLGIPAQDLLGDLVRAAERRPAQPDFDPVDEAVHALARYLLDPGQRRPCAGGTRHRGGDGMMTGQRQPPGEFEHVIRHVGGIGDVELRQGQRARLVEHHMVDFGQPLDGIAGIEQHAGPEHGARDDGLHRRDRQPERAGTGDDQHGDRGDDGIVPGRAERRPAQHGQQRRRMHHGGIEPRGAVGELHVAGARLHGVVEQPAISASSVPSDAADTRTRSAPDRLSVPA